MGRGVADTRTAMTTFMNMGMSLEQTQDTMKAVSVVQCSVIHCFYGKSSAWALALLILGRWAC